MIKLTHTSIIVSDQDAALDFYTKLLGFEKKMDSPMGEDRWLTVGCKGQDIEIILQMPHWGADRATTEERTSLIGKQSIYFATDNAQTTYDQFQTNGVKLLGTPQERPWGIEFQFEDLYGNVHGMVQLKNKN